MNIKQNFVVLFLTVVIFMTFIVPAGASTGTVDISKWSLKHEDISLVLAIDRSNDTYVGFYIRPEDGYLEKRFYERVVNQLNGIGCVKPVADGKTAEGDIVIKKTDGARYSYKLEPENILNINGKRYQLDEKQAQEFTLLRRKVRNSEHSNAFPKWLAWMKESNVVSVKQYQPLVPRENDAGIVYGESDILDFFCSEGVNENLDGGLFESYATIANGERYELGKAGLPKDEEYYELTLGFKSGVVYKIKSHGNILCVESSDMKYGCKYTLDFYGWQENVRDSYITYTSVWTPNPVA